MFMWFSFLSGEISEEQHQVSVMFMIIIFIWGRQKWILVWISIKLVQFLCSWIFFCWNFLHCNPVKMVCIETLSIQMNWIRFHIVKVLFMYPKLWYAIQILVYASAHAHCVSRHVQKRKEKKYRENITGNVKSTFVCIL